jgi:hypothetical protein
MANPWDVAPAPNEGDKSEDVTFAAVGRALSNWEYFEGYFSMVFSYLVGAGAESLAAIRAYGTVMASSTRQQMVQSAAEVYFRRNPSTDLENKLRELLKLAEKFTGRRNEIAHGIVQPYFFDKGEKGLEQRGFVLYPAYYATRRRKFAGDPIEHGDVITLTYVYSSIEIDAFGAEFRELAERAIGILTGLVGSRQGR